jgi:5-methylcytosine-specific restriction endonuclease McrA
MKLAPILSGVILVAVAAVGLYGKKVTRKRLHSSLWYVRRAFIIDVVLGYGRVEKLNTRAKHHFQKGKIMSRQKRVLTYKKWWDELVEMYGNVCFYCNKEIATTIDHVVPYSWDGDNSIENLVPACALCNCIAGDKMFESVIQKRAHIMSRRDKYKNKRAICTECLSPYSYRIHSPSLFLCAYCYDMEYSTNFSASKSWRQWTYELSDAGIMFAAHQKTKERVGRFSAKSRLTFLAVLIEEYAELLAGDDKFFRSLAGVK